MLLCVCVCVCLCICHRDKTQLSEGIVAKQKLIQERKGELEQLQGDVDMATRQREDLERDKAEAQNKLDQLDSEVRRLCSVMIDHVIIL